MVIVEQHPNIQKWTNIFRGGKLIGQLSCRAKALRLATRIAKQHKTAVLNLDTNKVERYDWTDIFTYHLMDFRSLY